MTSLVALIRWLRGRTATKVTPVAPGVVRVEINNNHIEVHGDVTKLYNNSRVREAMYGVVRPVEKQGIDEVRLKRGTEVLAVVEKGDVEYFALAPSAFSEVINEEERTGSYEVVTLSFTEGYRWRFSDGNAMFTAEIADKAFFDALQRGELAFGKGDILTMRLAVRRQRTDKGLKADYRVLEVLDVIPAPRQLSLLPAPTEDNED